MKTFSSIAQLAKFTSMGYLISHWSPIIFDLILAGDTMQNLKLSQSVCAIVN